MDLHELNDQLPQVSPNIETVGNITLKEGVNLELLFNGANGIYNLKYIWKLAKNFGFVGDWDNSDEIECAIEAENYLNSHVCKGCSIQNSDDVWIIRDGYDIETGEIYDDETSEEIETVRVPVL